jgi:hypothetical protein
MQPSCRYLELETTRRGESSKNKMNKNDVIQPCHVGNCRSCWTTVEKIQFGILTFTPNVEEGIKASKGATAAKKAAALTKVIMTILL